MPASPPDSSSSADDPDAAAPPWVGYWRVRRYGGTTPEVPTYYDASPASWDVVKDERDGLYVARHPILEVTGPTIRLKDEGEPDTRVETWRAEVEGDELRVVAATGPHEGAVGVAERIDTDPRTLIEQA
jgi:hypothetical protein